jgi:hypothetical protein
MSAELREKPVIKLVLHTSNLARAQTFYSTLGIMWVGGTEGQFDTSFRPEQAADVMGLPFLWGEFENIEFIFYFRESSAANEFSNTELCIRYASVGDSSRILKLLKELNLFVPAPGFSEFNRMIIDPDGRYVVLAEPDPFSIV